MLRKPVPAEDTLDFVGRLTSEVEDWYRELSRQLSSGSVTKPWREQGPNPGLIVPIFPNDPFGPFQRPLARFLSVWCVILGYPRLPRNEVILGIETNRFRRYSRGRRPGIDNSGRSAGGRRNREVTRIVRRDALTECAPRVPRWRSEFSKWRR